MEVRAFCVYLSERKEIAELWNLASNAKPTGEVMALEDRLNRYSQNPDRMDFVKKVLAKDLIRRISGNEEAREFIRRRSVSLVARTAALAQKYNWWLSDFLVLFLFLFCFSESY